MQGFDKLRAVSLSGLTAPQYPGSTRHYAECPNEMVFRGGPVEFARVAGRKTVAQ